MCDQDGVPVPNRFDTVTFSVTVGRILGVGNGNPNGHFPEQASTVSLFHSKAQIIVEGRAQAITVSADGLPSVTLSFNKE